MIDWRLCFPDTYIGEAPVEMFKAPAGALSCSFITVDQPCHIEGVSTQRKLFKHLHLDFLVKVGLCSSAQ